MTFRLLTTGGLNWGEFSSTRYDDKKEEAQPKNNEQAPKNWMNLEAIHNNVHVRTQYPGSRELYS